MKKDFSPSPPTTGSQGRDAGLPRKKPKPSSAEKGARKAESEWFGPQPVGRRKIARPFSANRPLEARLTASRARGAWRLDRPANRAAIRRILVREAARSRVKLAKVAIDATILRLELAAPRRENLALFFRAVAGRIPRAVTGTEKGRPLDGRFWDGLVATRTL